jgi:adenosylcobinamide-GDP ribazoletransferase
VSSVLTAFAFLTRLPVPGRLDGRLDRAAAWFPLVGLLVGGVAAGVRALADLALPPLPATVLAVIAAVLVTGALHEDGWADIADGLGAHAEPARRLDILRDPRIGAYGAIALVTGLLLVVTTVAALPTGDAARTLLVAHLLARWALLGPGLVLPPARKDGAGALLRPAAPALGVATALALAGALLIAGPAPGAAALGAAVLAALVATVVLRRAFGGITGDGYGATAKLTELLVCVTLAAWWA